MFALGLGEIDVDSALNQPLDARINLISARADELEELRVELAPADVFDRVGVPRPYFLTQLKFVPVTLPNGSLAIRVTSKDPVREPFLTFLVEVTWPKGRLLREYTVLLDPPEFAQQQAPQVSTPVAAEVPISQPPAEEIVAAEPEVAPPAQEEVDLEAIRAEIDRKLGIDHSEPVVTAEETEVEEIVEAEPTVEEIEEAVDVETQEVAAEPVEEDVIIAEDIEEDTGTTTEIPTMEPFVEDEGASSIPAGGYTTVKGDTLFAIAKATRGARDVTVNQMMLAIQQANPDAFIKNNINLLKSGVVLRIPEEVDAEATSSGQAVAEVARQNGLWREYRGQVTEKMSAVNVDAPDLVEEAADSAKESATEAKQVLKEKESTQPKQELNILAGADGESTNTGATQVAGGEELEKLQKDQAALKELVQSREKENEDLKSRVEALESMLEKKDKIINIQNDQLNNLKQQLDTETSKAIEAEKQLQEKTSSQAPKPKSEQQAVTQPKPKEIKPPEVESLPDWETLPEIESPEQETTVQETLVAKPKLEPLPDWESLPEIELPGEVTPSEETQVAETPTEEVKPTETVTQPKEQPVEVAEPVTEEKGLVAKLMGFLDPIKSMIRENSGIGAAALAVIAVLLGMFAWKQKRSAKRVETMTMGMPEPLEDDQYDDILDETIITPTDAPVEAAESIEEVAFESTADVVGSDDELAEPMSAEGGTPDDVLEEADVYISYGLHQQAQDLLNDAIAAEPNRNDYKVKLAEVFYSAKDKEAFEKHAESIKDQLGESSSDWQNIISMGKELAPSSALFAGAAAIGVAANALAEKSDAEDVDIGLQTAINETLSDDDLEDTVIDASTSNDDEGLDFNIDEQVTESFDDDPVASKIMEANETSDILNFEVDDLADAENIEDLKDTESDLESIATGIHEATGIHDSLNLDEEMTEELEEVSMQTTVDDLQPLEMDEESLDTTVALQTDEDFDVGLDTAANLDDPDATAAYMQDQQETEQFDSSNLDTEFLDPAEATVAQTATDLKELGPPSLIEEVSTKLDLAKAFVDMGDADAAKETLLEVINEGDESQIEEARELMEKLGA